MPTRHFDLVSHWCLTAPVDRVWDALTTLSTWPRWWPGVRSVRPLRSGDADGLGSVHRIEWATRWPLRPLTKVRAIEVRRFERLRTRTGGHLCGEAIWLLRSEGRQTHVTHLWRVQMTAPWMRWLAPALVPLLRWNHVGVMRAGAAGLAAYLSRKPQTRQPLFAGRPGP